MNAIETKIAKAEAEVANVELVDYLVQGVLMELEHSFDPQADALKARALDARRAASQAQRARLGL